MMCGSNDESADRSFARFAFDFERLVSPAVCMKSEVQKSPPGSSQESASLLKRLAGPSSAKAGSVLRAPIASTTPKD